MHDQLINLCKQVIASLLNDDYESLRRANVLTRLSEADIKKVLKEYRGVLSVVPDYAFDTDAFCIFKYKDNSGYAIDLDLWIDNSRSDLTLQLEIKTNAEDQIESFTIHDLHVL